MFRLMQRLKQDERGATAVEYGFLLVTIVLAMMAALSGVADATTTMWTDIKDKSAEATGN